jgi:hypothetical protein
MYLLDNCPEKVNVKDIRSRFNLKQGQVAYLFRYHADIFKHVKKDHKGVRGTMITTYQIQKKDMGQAYETIFSSEFYKS